MSTDQNNERSDGPGKGAEVESRRVAARRRFLRGAGGSAALVLTVTHRRAFAGVKKNVVASNCGSIMGVPDLKGVTAKKGLETSAMGTPKGAMCRPRPPIKDENNLGDCMQMDESKYYKKIGVNSYQKVQFVKSSQLKHGCGSVMPDAMPPNNTIAASYNYRLYEKGYCPIVWQGDELIYDSNAKYYKEDGEQFSCLMP